MSTPASHPIDGFAPLLPQRPRLLILGSMPSVASLHQQRYYGHQRNRFWPIIATLFGGDFDSTYAQRVELLLAQRIALWDVLARCVRPGSADAAIVSNSEIANPIDELLQAHPTIERICFNGATAQSCFRRHFGNKLAIPTHRLPSTSPANAAWSLDALCSAWSIIRCTENGSWSS